MKQHPLLASAELRAKGFEALLASFGWVNAVRFIQEYEPSRLDYTRERDGILPNWAAEEIIQKLKKISDDATG